MVEAIHHRGLQAMRLTGILKLSGLVFAIMAFAPAAVLAPAVLADTVPHRALYSLSLGTAKPSGGFSDVQGAVKTRVEKTCDAWITTEQIQMRVATQTGAFMHQDLNYTGWESLDGKNYRFAASSVLDGEETRYRGMAEADPDGPGKPGLAVFREPKKFDMALPPGTRFYFGLTAWLIEQAETDAKRAETIVFDGTDEEGPQRVVAVFLPLKKKPAGRWRKFGALLDRPGWTARLAFFTLGSKKAAPDYEVEAVVLDNGVTPWMELVFSEFTAIQKLEKIEALKGPVC